MKDTLNLVNFQVRISKEEHEALLELKKRTGERSLQQLARKMLARAAQSQERPAPRSWEHAVLDELLRQPETADLAREMLKAMRKAAKRT